MYFPLIEIHSGLFFSGYINVEAAVYTILCLFLWIEELNAAGFAAIYSQQCDQIAFQQSQLQLERHYQEGTPLEPNTLGL